MRCCQQRKPARRLEDVFEPRPPDAPRAPTNILVSAAAEFVLAAVGNDAHVLKLAHKRFDMVYNVFAARRDLTIDAVAYAYARCVLCAHRANVPFRDAPVRLLRDGVHRPFSVRRASV